MITSGVATPNVASNNIAVVIKAAATNPASNPAKIAFVLFMRIANCHKLRAAMESNYAAHRAKIGCQSSQPDSAGGLPACPELIRQASSLKAESAKLANIHFHTIFPRENFPCTLHDHLGSDLFHAGVIKRALAQPTVIAWRTW